MLELENKIATLTAGRAAEELKFDTVSTGASNDLESATDIAIDILTRYGMEEGFLVSLPIETIMKSTLAETYHKRLNDILVRELVYTEEIIRDNKDKVKALADALIDQSRLDTEDMAKILGIKEESSDVKPERKKSPRKKPK